MKKRAQNLLPALVLLAIGPLACAQESWDLAGNWNPPANPNGAWTYGDYDSNSLVKLSYVTNAINLGVGAYLPMGGMSDGFIYKNLTANAAYGIAPGQISLEANFGTPVARWTSPASGWYNVSLMIGGTTAIEGPTQVMLSVGIPRQFFTLWP